MGWIDHICDCWKHERNSRTITIVVLGLDSAGKTVIVNALIGGQRDNVIATNGFSVHKLKSKWGRVRIFDVGGGRQIRAIWPQYYADAHGFLFIIDASDYSRFAEVSSELEKFFTHDTVRGKPLLILANKQDLPQALDELDIEETLNLESLVNQYRCPTSVKSCSGLNPSDSSPGVDFQTKENVDEKLLEGLDWLLQLINESYVTLNMRVEQDRKTLADRNLSVRTMRMAKFRERLSSAASSFRSGKSNKLIGDDGRQSVCSSPRIFVHRDGMRVINDIKSGNNSAINDEIEDNGHENLAFSNDTDQTNENIDDEDTENVLDEPLEPLEPLKVRKEDKVKVKKLFGRNNKVVPGVVKKQFEKVKRNIKGKTERQIEKPYETVQIEVLDRENTDDLKRSLRNGGKTSLKNSRKSVEEVEIFELKGDRSTDTMRKVVESKLPENGPIVQILDVKALNQYYNH